MATIVRRNMASGRVLVLGNGAAASNRRNHPTDAPFGTLGRALAVDRMTHRLIGSIDDRRIYRSVVFGALQER